MKTFVTYLPFPIATQYYVYQISAVNQNLITILACMCMHTWRVHIIVYHAIMYVLKQISELPPWISPYKPLY